jgi:hypothetical protein
MATVRTFNRRTRRWESTPPAAPILDPATGVASLPAGVLAKGEIEAVEPGKGLIVRSPDGQRWRLTPDDSGASVWTPIP